jgi:hypothetical protein
MAVSQLVASGAEADQVFKAIIPKAAPRSDVVDLQIFNCKEKDKRMCDER